MPALVLCYFGQGALILRDPGDRREPVLRHGALRRGDARARRPLERRHRDRVAGAHLGRLLAHAPGDAARLLPARHHQAHGGAHRGADLHPADQLDPGGRVPPPRPRLPEVGPPRVGVRHRGDGHDGAHVARLLRGDAPHVEVVGAGVASRCSRCSSRSTSRSSPRTPSRSSTAAGFPSRSASGSSRRCSSGARGARSSSRSTCVAAPRSKRRSRACSPGSSRGSPERASSCRRPATHAPPVMVHMIERERALHEKVVLLTVLTETVPEVPEASTARRELAGQRDLPGSSRRTASCRSRTSRRCSARRRRSSG